MAGSSEVTLFSKVSNVIGSVAPALATALGGPLAGSVVSLLGNALGLDSGVDPESLLTAIQSPEAMLKIRALELTHETELRNIALLEQQASNADLQDARASKIATEKYTGKKDWIVGFIVISVVVFFGLSLVGAYFHGEPLPQNFSFLQGQLSGFFAAIVAFYFSGIDPKKMFTDARASLEK